MINCNEIAEIYCIAKSVDSNIELDDTKYTTVQHSKLQWIIIWSTAISINRKQLGGGAPLRIEGIGVQPFLLYR